MNTMKRRSFLRRSSMMPAALPLTTLLAHWAEEHSKAWEEGANYTSDVPQYTFANTLKEQEEQLKANPLMRRFIESRKEKVHHKDRPICHFIAPESFNGDPNGLCRWQGRWHLFYQAWPNTLRRYPRRL
jgi:hypothetical protein